MLPYRDSKLTKLVLAVFFVIILGYAYYEARGLLFGPRITVPSEIQEVNEQFVIIKGKADRISSLSMNGKPISVTEEGDFQKPFLLSPGLNRIILDAKDKYGRSSQKVVQIVYIATSTPAATPETATSSANGATSTPAE